jgi:glycine hydroxymethyltransferase
MKTILFICTGNICRSPMAEGLMRHALNGTDIRVLSAGVGAGHGQPPSGHSVRALQEWGIDIGHQRSQPLTAELVDQADLILGMTRNHVDTVLMMYPEAADKVHRLRDFDPQLDEYDRDICDPIGGS